MYVICVFRKIDLSYIIVNKIFVHCLNAGNFLFLDSFLILYSNLSVTPIYRFKPHFTMRQLNPNNYFAFFAQMNNLYPTLLEDGIGMIRL